MQSLKILCLSSIKGGVGKTVASVNIAGCLAKLEPDKDFILIDLDPQGNSSMYLGFTAKNIERGTQDVFEGDKPLEYSINTTSIENLFVIPCEISLRNIQLQISLGELKFDNPSNILKNKIDDFRNKIVRDTYIILDTHPDFDIFTVNALMCSDRVICPILPCEFAIHGFDLLVNNIDSIREKYNKRLRVMGLFKSNWNKSNTTTVKDIECGLGYYDKFLMNTTIPSSIDVEKSKNERIPLVYSSCRNNQVSKNYMKLAEEILKRWERVIR